MTLKKGIWKSARKMRPEKVRLASGKYNPIMQEVMSNQKIAVRDSLIIVLRDKDGKVTDTRVITGDKEIKKEG
jgi:hypothetical protein